MAFRYDIGTLRAPRYLADGGALLDATLTRTGVFVYYDDDGKEFPEYRPPEEVFDPVSMQSFAGVPITDDHPDVMITAENRDTFKRGRVGDTIKRDGIHMVGTLLIDDAALLKKMKDGKREVSNGYTCDLDMTAGVSPEGVPYRAIQRNIRGNHTAVVDAGRAGSARARMDGAAYQKLLAPAARPDPASPLIPRVDHHQELIVMEELQKKLGEALATVAAEKARADALAIKCTTTEQALTDMTTKHAAEKLRADKATGDAESAKLDAQKARTDAQAKAPEQAKARAKLITKASKVVGDKLKIDGKDTEIHDCTDHQIMCAVVQKVDGLDLAKEQERPGYVEGRFDGACERHTAGAAAAGVVAGVVAAQQGDGKPAPEQNPANPKRLDAAGSPDPETAARNKMMKDNRNEWKPTAARTEGN